MSDFCGCEDGMGEVGGYDMTLAPRLARAHLGECIPEFAHSRCRPEESPPHACGAPGLMYLSRTTLPLTPSLSYQDFRGH